MNVLLKKMMLMVSILQMLCAVYLTDCYFDTGKKGEF